MTAQQGQTQSSLASRTQVHTTDALHFAQAAVRLCEVLALSLAALHFKSRE
jgi:hypothetical protein